MFALLLICAALFASHSFGESTDSSPTAIAKCDPEIQKKIEELQCYYGRNGLLIKTAAANGIEFAKASSYSFCSENVTCLYTMYIPNENCTSATVVMNYVYADNSTTQENITVVEKCGSTYDQGTNIRRENIWSGNGTSVVYACSEHEDAKTGSPLFYIKCAAGYCDDANVKEGADVLKRIGYTAPKNYSICIEYQEFIVG